MKYTQLHKLLKEHGIIFTLNIDPETLPYGHVANFTLVATTYPAELELHVPSSIATLRSRTTHIHPDIITGEIWEEMKKSPLNISGSGNKVTLLITNNEISLKREKRK